WLDCLSRFARLAGLGKNLALSGGSFAGGRTGEFFLSLRFRFFLRLLPFRVAVLAFDVAHLFLKRHLEVVGSFAEFRHQLAQAAGELRQLVRAKKDQHDDKQHHEMRNTEHVSFNCSRLTSLWHHKADDREKAAPARRQLITWCPTVSHETRHEEGATANATVRAVPACVTRPARRLRAGGSTLEMGTGKTEGCCRCLPRPSP